MPEAARQTPNEILLNYPKLRGDKGAFSTKLVPPRENPQSRPPPGSSSRSSRRTTSGSVQRVTIQGIKSPDVADDEGRRDEWAAIDRRPSLVGRMSQLGLLRTPSHSVKSRVGSATSSQGGWSSGKSGRSRRVPSAVSTRTSGSSFSLLLDLEPSDAHSVAMRDLEIFRASQYGRPLSRQVLVDDLKEVSRLRRLKRMTREELENYRVAREPASIFARFFSLRIAFKLVGWKNRAKAKLAILKATEKERERRRKYVLSLFRKTARKMIMLRRWLLTIIENSKARTERTALELQFSHMSLEAAAKRKIQFSADDFKNHQPNSRMPHWARVILRTPPEERGKAELKALHGMFRGLSHFDKFTYRVQMEMCKACYLLDVESMRVILREGHHGTAFYFIYSGSVFVNKMEMNDRTGIQMQKTKAILTRGEGFGEIALLKDCSRMASVIAREDCELICVEKDIFAAVCPKLFDEELQNRVDYMRGHPLFRQGWDPTALYNIALSSSVSEHAINQVVSKSSLTDEYMYFIMSGSCTVLKVMHIEEERAQSARLVPEDRVKVKPKEKEEVPVKKKDEDAEFVQLKQQRQKLSTQEDAVQVLKERAKANTERAKTSLLDAMDMNYSHEMDGKHDLLQEIISESKGMDVAKKQEEQARRELERMAEGTSSLTVFIDSTERSARLEGKLALFLSVGKLERGEVFNMRQEVRKKPNENHLLLVSDGCKLLKVRILDFVRSLKEQELFLFLSKKIGDIEKSFPGDEQTVQLYNRNCNWEAFKQARVNIAVHEFGSQLQKHSIPERKSLMESVGKPWRAAPETWLSRLNGQHRRLEIKRNTPLKPPIY